MSQQASEHILYQELKHDNFLFIISMHLLSLTLKQYI